MHPNSVFLPENLYETEMKISYVSKTPYSYQKNPYETEVKISYNSYSYQKNPYETEMNISYVPKTPYSCPQILMKRRRTFHMYPKLRIPAQKSV